MNSEELAFPYNVRSHFWTDRMYGVTEEFSKPKTPAELATRSLRLGKAFASLGKSADAKREFNAARNFDPQNTEILEERALLLIRLQQYEDALDDLALAQSLAPCTEQLHLARAQAYYSLDAKTSSIDELDLAIALNESCDVAFYYKSIILLEFGDYLNAVNNLNAAISLVQSALYLVLRGYAQAHLGNFEAAIADYTDAIENDPTKHETFLGRGSMFMEADKFELAIEDFDVVISWDPSNAHAWFKRGLANLLQGENASALADLKKAGLIEPLYAPYAEDMQDQLA